MEIALRCGKSGCCAGRYLSHVQFFALPLDRCLDVRPDAQRISQHTYWAGRYLDNQFKLIPVVTLNASMPDRLLFKLAPPCSGAERICADGYKSPRPRGVHSLSIRQYRSNGFTTTPDGCGKQQHISVKARAQSEVYAKLIQKAKRQCKESRPTYTASRCKSAR